MLVTILSIVGLVLLLVVMLAAWEYWTRQGPLGFVVAWNLMDGIGHVLCAIFYLIGALLNGGDN